MCLEESDVSILIPSYNQKALLINAVNSALKTKAGEIIISDDHSLDGTLEFLLNLKDHRIKIIQPNKNLGLWANHLFLLENSTNTWVKFLQQDDEILENGLFEMCKLVNKETVIVSSLPLYKSLENKKTFSETKLNSANRYSSDQFLNLCLRSFNILGTPSYTLIKKDVLDTSTEAWKNDMSCDMTGNIIAGSKGEVVIMPPQFIIRGIHDNQDNNTQSPELRLSRFKNSMKYLLKSNDERIKKIISISTFVEIFFFIKGFFGLLKRKKKIKLSYLFSILGLIRFVNINHIIMNMHNLFFLFKYKIYWNKGLNLNSW